MLTKEKTRETLILLGAAYPDAGPELLYTTPFELLVATILSAQCTDKQVNKCTRALFQICHTPAQFAALAEEELAPHIKSCGFYQTKARHIIEAGKRIMQDFNGEVPRTMQELTSLPGVGRKTANVVMSNAFGIPAIAVDTHVFRVANRIGITDAGDVLKTEEQLKLAIPREYWSDAHHWLIFHGRRVCNARKPLCGQCCLTYLCEYHAKITQG
ncbi:MAG: endonuclease III [Clostridiales bacterium]|jgi:endonuclease-3|nr:endonuclease III [Clostridiales bacterium]